jgi:hypothetical protein
MEAGGLMAGRGDGQRTARHGMIEDCEANERTTQRVDAGGDSRSRSGTRAAGEGEQPVHGDHPAYDKAGLEAASDRRTTQRMTSGRSAWHRTACGSLHRGHLDDDSSQHGSPGLEVASCLLACATRVAHKPQNANGKQARPHRRGRASPQWRARPQGCTALRASPAPRCRPGTLSTQASGRSSRKQGLASGASPGHPTATVQAIACER